VASIRVREAEVFISGPKPNVVQWLVVEPAPEICAPIADQFERLSPPTLGCDLYREWFTGWSGTGIFTEWKLYRPGLRTFIRQIASKFPNLSIAEDSRSELDLTGLARKPELEQRKLLAQAKRLGFGAACVFALMNHKYKRMSMAEAREYMSNIDMDTDVDGRAAS
jgi:hypothetical protein